MTTLRTVAVHEVVDRTFPRPPRDGEELAKAVGRAIDGALSEIGHRARIGRRPTVGAMRAIAATHLDDEIEAAGVDVPAAERAEIALQSERLLDAFRGSPIFGLPRPKTRVILIGDDVAVYAQPDYWDGARRFYEMKSYNAIPPPPDVALQVRLFQLAFPGLESIVIAFDRRADPVVARTATVPPPTSAETVDALRRARTVALEVGVPKVREYLEGPFVAYPDPA